MKEVSGPAPGGHEVSEADVAALRQLLVAAVSRVCPRWLADQAEDIVQNALLQLFGALKKRGGKIELSSTYVRKVAHGVTVDEIRRRCRRKEDTAVEAESIERTASGHGNPERETAAHEIGRGVADCLARLAGTRRLAVTLFLRGCSVPEAARRLRWTVKKAEHLVYRGLHDLRRCLAAKGIEP